VSRNYKFNNPDAAFFVSFSVVEWLHVFTRNEYKDILLHRLSFVFRPEDYKFSSAVDYSEEKCCWMELYWLAFEILHPRERIRAGAGEFPNRPQIDDPTKSKNSFGIPKVYFEELLKSMKNPEIFKANDL
jgi:hypothetical protein